jgi:hypothetical protein
MGRLLWASCILMLQWLLSDLQWLLRDLQLKRGCRWLLGLMVAAVCICDWGAAVGGLAACSCKSHSCLAAPSALVSMLLLVCMSLVAQGAAAKDVVRAMHTIRHQVLRLASCKGLGLSGLQL